MRVLVAFDKFKDALTAREACEIAARALHEKHPDWLVDLCPLTDGGDGFEDILGGCVQGNRTALQATGPRGSLIEAGFTTVSISQIPRAARDFLPFTAPDGIEPTLAIIEMAAASGLSLLPPGQRTPWETTSRGTGQLIRAAAESGASAILLGVGGSATHDLGLGALSALGLEFRTATGEAIRPPVPSRWEQIIRIEGQVASTIPQIYIACDVRNPLLGPTGAAAVFAPQKGLRPDEFLALETASERMAQLLCNHCHQPPTLPGTPGVGAAGGIAFGLVCAARACLLPGYDLVSDWLGLDEKISSADLILTGEGRFDAASHAGKGPGALAAHAISLGKTVHVFAGQTTASINPDRLTLHEISPTDVPLDRALRDASAFLARAIQHAL